jgi:hypothetical protein
MTLRWRNGVLHVGHDIMRRGFSIELLWNRREDLNDRPEPGEIIFADGKRLTWYRGDWWPRYYSCNMDLMT